MAAATAPGEPDAGMLSTAVDATTAVAARRPIGLVLGCGCQTGGTLRRASGGCLRFRRAGARSLPVSCQIGRSSCSFAGWELARPWGTSGRHSSALWHRWQVTGRRHSSALRHSLEAASRQTGVQDRRGHL